MTEPDGPPDSREASKPDEPARADPGPAPGGSSDPGIAEAVNSAKLATLGMLVAGVAHEVNTPLGALTSNHDVLKRALSRLHEILADDVVDESELVEVRRIVRALNGIMRVNDLAMERVLSLVGSLRSFGRLDRSEIDRVDVHDGIDTAITLLRHKLENRVRIERDFDAVPPIECFPQRLNQVFMNLILNAIQAIEGPGTVTIRTRFEEDGVLVEVSDTGPGIPEHLEDTIFEPGFTTRGNRVGMGMGLMIADQVVNRHGGRMEARNLPDGGACFSVRLPMVLPREPEGR